ncbi:hypothetical protein DFS34DRAFT_607563 [Phlyctochytrium arcticum]|nr:hypothetical protein DFS34DRAFT_607563 [Phlyctochytrium arcticum]
MVYRKASEPIYDEYISFLYDHGGTLSECWSLVDSVEIASMFVDRSPVTAEVLEDATRHPDVFSLLLSHLPNPAPTPDWYGEWYIPALYGASSKGHLESLKILLARDDVNVNADGPEANEPYVVARSFATRSTDTADFLLSKGAPVGRPELHSAIDDGISAKYIKEILIERHGARPAVGLPYGARE